MSLYDIRKHKSKYKVFWKKSLFIIPLILFLSAISSICLSVFLPVHYSFNNKNPEDLKTHLPEFNNLLIKQMDSINSPVNEEENAEKNSNFTFMISSNKNKQKPNKGYDALGYMCKEQVSKNIDSVLDNPSFSNSVDQSADIIRELSNLLKDSKAKLAESQDVSGKITVDYNGSEGVLKIFPIRLDYPWDVSNGQNISKFADVNITANKDYTYTYSMQIVLGFFVKIQNKLLKNLQIYKKFNYDIQTTPINGLSLIKQVDNITKDIDSFSSSFSSWEENLAQTILNSYYKVDGNGEWGIYNSNISLNLPENVNQENWGLIEYDNRIVKPYSGLGANMIKVISKPKLNNFNSIISSLGMSPLLIKNINNTYSSNQDVYTGYVPGYKDESESSDDGNDWDAHKSTFTGEIEISFLSYKLSISMSYTQYSYENEDKNVVLSNDILLPILNKIMKRSKVTNQESDITDFKDYAQSESNINEIKNVIYDKLPNLAKKSENFNKDNNIAVIIEIDAKITDNGENPYATQQVRRQTGKDAQGNPIYQYGEKKFYHVSDEYMLKITVTYNFKTLGKASFSLTSNSTKTVLGKEKEVTTWN